MTYVDKFEVSYNVSGAGVHLVKFDLIERNRTQIWAYRPPQKPDAKMIWSKTNITHNFH